MKRRIFLPGPLLFALACAAVSGCAVRVPPPPAPAPASPPSPATPAPAAPIPAPATASVPPVPPPVSVGERAHAGGMAALQEGGYERALELFSAALKERPGHAESLKGFDEALVALEKQGHVAYDNGKPEEAGKRWAAVLRHIGQPAAKGRAYPFTRAEVQGRIDRITAAQMEKGLLNYRKGDIPAAISAWKAILAYDPENEEAARSIRTASTQLENLKKIPPAQ